MDDKSKKTLAKLKKKAQRTRYEIKILNRLLGELVTRKAWLEKDIEKFKEGEL